MEVGNGLWGFGAAIAAIASVYVGVSLWGRRRAATASAAAIGATSIFLATIFASVTLVILPVLAHRLLPLSLSLPLPLAVQKSAGAALIVLGLAGMLYCADAFGRRGRGTPSPLHAPTALVTSGLFGLIRNPIIACEVLVIWGEAVYFSNAGIAIYALIFSLGTHIGVVLWEEPMLRELFGDDYAAYCRNVPRWFPLQGGRLIVKRLGNFVRGRPSTTQSTTLLWLKSLLNTVFFFFGFMVAFPWIAHQLLPALLPVPASLRTWGGAVLFTMGMGGWIACLDAFSRRGRGTPLPSDAPRHLVIDGLHGVVRNPIVVAEQMVIWSEALYFRSAGLVCYAVLATLLLRWIVVRVEEPELRKRFGESYEEYCRNVPRWLPRILATRPTRKGAAQ